MLRTLESDYGFHFIDRMAENEVLKWKDESKENEKAFNKITNEKEFHESGIITFEQMAVAYGTETAFLEDHKISGVNRNIVLPLLKKLRPHWKSGM